MYQRHSRPIFLYSILLVLVCLLSQAQSSPAAELLLPHELGVSAQLFTTSRDTLWEKSLIIRLDQPRHLLSTADGIIHGRAVINHGADPKLWMKVAKELDTPSRCGGKVYEQQRKELIARKLGFQPAEMSLIGTAADMDNLAVVTRQYAPFTVTALVTGGVKNNALRAGVDEGTHIEPQGSPAGTINIIVLTNARLTDGALARAIVTVTEAKTSALEDLKVPSSYTKGVQATGTGTDSVIVVSGATGPVVTYTGGHSRIGDLIAKAVHQAVLEALEKQNGLKMK